MKNKIILTDADGVLLDWEYAFDIFMTQQGYSKVPGGRLKYKTSTRYGIPDDEAWRLVKIFNESAHMGFLPALRDSMYYVKRLHEEHGYVFHCITSMSKNENACDLRRMNLRKLFGRTAFDTFIFLDTSADKDEALELYRDSGYYWIEDKITNAEVGHKLGLQSIIMEHGHNMEYENPNIPRVKNWKEIYDLLVTSDRSTDHT
jgi:FMN phosphatase YigB (HAD superfamily)